MDVYKLIILIIGINLFISIGTAAIESGNFMENFTHQEAFDYITRSGDDIGDTATDGEELASEQGGAGEEETGGMSKTIATWKILAVIWNILFGGLAGGLGIAFSNAGEEPVIIMMGWGIALFVGALNILLGMKIYNIFASKDPR